MSAVIKFHNTLSGTLDEFKPLKEGEAKLYTCGPTVYDYAHIGNFRAFVFEDLLRRFLEFSGYKVKHVMNLTDVDDKTIAGAQREKVKLADYTAKYTRAFNEDLKTLNCLPPSSQPSATKKIKQMQDLIAKLIAKDIAYVKDGSVYYRVAKFQGYGKLSKKKLEMNITGASERIESDEYESKEHATDFVLWKAAKEGEAELGAAWDSPWGKGRPGWHIECSAMSMEELGETFDLHAGGEDLIFPHHENEIAQSEGATGKKFVNFWLHCKFLLVNGEKMSKSKGNFYTLRDLIAKGHDPMAIRYALLSTHYRNTLNFTENGIKEAGETIRRFNDCYLMVKALPGKSEGYDAGYDKGASVTGIEEIVNWLADDLNTSAAFASLGELITDINKRAQNMNSEALLTWAIFFEKIDRLFGFNITHNEIPKSILDKLTNLHDFRKAKNFQEADKLRKELNDLGWLVKDGKPGEPSTVTKKR